MTNPSTVADILQRQLEEQRGLYHNLRLGKSTREAALRRVRQLEEELDLPEAERTPAHNGQPAEREDSTRVLGTTRFERGILLDALRKAVNDKDSDGVINERRWALIREIEAL